MALQYYKKYLSNSVVLSLLPSKINTKITSEKIATLMKGDFL